MPGYFAWGLLIHEAELWIPFEFAMAPHLEVWVMQMLQLRCRATATQIALSASVSPQEITGSVSLHYDTAAKNWPYDLDQKWMTLEQLKKTKCQVCLSQNDCLSRNGSEEDGSVCYLTAWQIWIKNVSVVPDEADRTCDWRSRSQEVLVTDN